jgi:hypothetical protein
MPPGPNAAELTLATGSGKNEKELNDPVGPVVVVGKLPPLITESESIYATLTEGVAATTCAGSTKKVRNATKKMNIVEILGE